MQLEAVYSAMVCYYRDHGVPPTRRAICKACNLSSTSVAEFYIRRLVKLERVLLVDRHPVPVEIQRHLAQYTPKTESK